MITRFDHEVDRRFRRVQAPVRAAPAFRAMAGFLQPLPLAGALRPATAGAAAAAAATVTSGRGRGRGGVASLRGRWRGHPRPTPKLPAPAHYLLGHAGGAARAGRTLGYPQRTVWERTVSVRRVLGNRAPRSTRPPGRLVTMPPGKARGCGNRRRGHARMQA